MIKIFMDFKNTKRLLSFLTLETGNGGADPAGFGCLPQPKEVIILRNLERQAIE